MEFSGQLHVSAALLLGKQPLEPTQQRAGWIPETVENHHTHKKKKQKNKKKGKKKNPYQELNLNF
jgi:hypothetical protein